MNTTLQAVDGTRAIGDLAPIDRLVDLIPGQSARGIRNVGGTQDIYDSHFPFKPVLPGVLLLGSAVRLAGTLAGESSLGGMWTLRSAERLRYRGFVQPGDSVHLTVEVLDLTRDLAAFSVVGEVDGKRVFTARKITLDSGGEGR